jgi:structural maintenance of chromosome 2
VIDAETAKRVTFDKDVRIKSVTLEGDVYDPAGTLQGGSKPNSAGILIRIQELHEARAKLQSLQTELAQVNQKLANMAQHKEQYHQLTQQRDLKMHQQTLAQEQLASSPQAQVSCV